MMFHSKLKDMKIHVGDQAPTFAVTTKARKVAEEEASKEEGIKRDKGEEVAEENVANNNNNTNAPTTASPPPTTTSPTPSTTIVPEKIFDLSEVMQGAHPQHYFFLFFYRDNSDFEDREEMWSIRDAWGELQKIGRGVTVYGFSTKEKMERIQMMRRKVMLPFEIYPDSHYEALSTFVTVGGAAKLLGAKANCGILMMGDRKIVSIYSDHWSVNQLMHDLKQIEQRIAEGKPPVDTVPIAKENVPAKSDEGATVSGEGSAMPTSTEGTATATEGTEAAETTTKKKSKKKDKEKEKEKAAEGGDTAPPKKERTRGMSFSFPQFGKKKSGSKEMTKEGAPGPSTEAPVAMDNTNTVVPPDSANINNTNTDPTQATMPELGTTSSADNVATTTSLTDSISVNTKQD